MVSSRVRVSVTVTVRGRVLCLTLHTILGALKGQRDCGEGSVRAMVIRVRVWVVRVRATVSSRLGPGSVRVRS